MILYKNIQKIIMLIQTINQNILILILSVKITNIKMILILNSMNH